MRCSNHYATSVLKWWEKVTYTCPTSNLCEILVDWGTSVTIRYGSIKYVTFGEMCDIRRNMWHSVKYVTFGEICDIRWNMWYLVKCVTFGVIFTSLLNLCTSTVRASLCSSGYMLYANVTLTHHFSSCSSIVAAQLHVVEINNLRWSSQFMYSIVE